MVSRGSKLNRRSKEVSSITEESFFPSSSGVIDKIPHRVCPKVQVQDTGQALFFFSRLPLCLNCIIHSSAPSQRELGYK